MKHLITLFVIFLMSITTINANIVRNGNTFKVETTSDTQTKYTWEDKQGNKYPIYITKKGACYILKISKKTGKEYKYYLPKEIQKQIRYDSTGTNK